MLFIGLVSLLPELGQLVAVIVLAQVGLSAFYGAAAHKRTPHNQYLVPASVSIGTIAPPILHSRILHSPTGRSGHIPGDIESVLILVTVNLHIERGGGSNAGIIHYRDASDLEGKRLFYSGHMSIPAIEGGRIRGSEVLSGVLPALFAPSLARAAVIGVGTGITAGTTSRIFDSTDAIEISASVLALLPRFADANFDLAHNPAARIIHNDARVFLATSAPVYDVVLNSVSLPSFEAASKIYTTEFFRWRNARWYRTVSS